jgi:DNA-binding MarR family transcriptional regulator
MSDAMNPRRSVTGGRKGKTALTQLAWRLMFDYLMATSDDRARSLERRGLTPNDARALWSLDAQRARPIGALARDWGCDPANATFIINRLERAGLAKRRQSDSDRRVKLVTLTAKGAATMQALLDEYRRPPADLLELHRSELEDLVRILAKLRPAALTRDR